MQKKAVRIRIIGLVQGVGFRPFIHRLAEKHGLNGYVVNLGGSEVEVHVEGPSSSINSFLNQLVLMKPPPSVIKKVEVTEVPPKDYPGFKILPSRKTLTERSAIPPDFGICEDCLREILDPRNRRYGYPWNSCAWCGPRFSMIYRVPYDRENTSMNQFPLCNECLSEYRDLDNERRYHAQGISCQVCGPKTYLLDNRGYPINTKDPIREAARLLDEGRILAIKGVGGYHIASLATDDSVVSRVRGIKQRPTQPLALMVRDCEKAEELVYLEDKDCAVLKSSQRPILLLERRPNAPVSELVAPNMHWLGIMLPYTGLQALLLKYVRDGFLIMTSGNKHGFPMCKDLGCVLDQIGGEIDYILEHNRVIVHRVDDSVVRWTRGHLLQLRRSRGYAPYWIEASVRIPEAISLGAELQTAGGISFDNKVILTQYIGDLDNPVQLDELHDELKWLVDQYKLKPEYLVLDKHPSYSNRRIAPYFIEEYGSEPVEVQHHCAHALSLIVDRGLDPLDNYPAVVVDGAGYGDDGAIWGGEALTVTGGECKRISHIHYYPLPGGDAATKNPIRVLIGILQMEMNEDEVVETLSKLGKIPNIISEERARLIVQLSKHSPMTSSAGRLADALSALLGISYKRTYEGEPAITLESRLLAERVVPSRRLEIPVRKSMLDPYGSVMFVAESLVEGRMVEALRRAATVLYWIGYGLAKKALAVVRNDILFSGGAAVNEFIAMGVEDAAESYGVNVIYHKNIPPGDGGIAAGQLLFTRHLLN